LILSLQQGEEALTFFDGDKKYPQVCRSSAVKNIREGMNAPE
jgi:hypothetical protein